MKEPKPPEVLIVNKEIYVKCLIALGTLLEQNSESFEDIRRSTQFRPSEKKVLLTLLGNHMEALAQIVEGLEMSCESPVEPYYTKPDYEQ